MKDQNHMRSGVQATAAESKYSSAEMLRFVSNDTIKILRQKLRAPTVPGVIYNLCSGFSMYLLHFTIAGHDALYVLNRVRVTARAQLH